MQPPFPGMDPYLEGHLWSDFHHTLAVYIKAQLVSQISPKYLVRTEIYTVLDTAMEKDIGIMYPDVSVFKNQKIKEPAVAYGNQSEPPAATPPTTIIREQMPVEVRIPVIEIRDKAHNQLVTAIEILSPVNKRTPGLIPYRKKRKQLHESGVHLIEIDLLRRGTRPIKHPNLPQSHYLISLWRGNSVNTEIWAIDVKDALPIINVPLLPIDDDAVLAINRAFIEVYQMSQYQTEIDYTKSPVLPTFSKSDQEWMRNLFTT